MDKDFYNESSAAKLGWEPEWFGCDEFDEDLVEAIKKFQKKNGMSADGLCGPGTFRVLFNERMEDIENRVNKEFAGAADMQKQQDVTDINNKALIGDHAKMQNEKMKGRFEVTINKNLEMKKRIQKFGNEPICYYLHKNRNFLQKLEDKRNRVTAEDKVMDFRNNFHEI